MGKVFSLYLDDEATELVGSIEGRGTLINNLIKEHFSDDEDFLNRKKKQLENGLNSINARLQEKINKKLEHLKEIEAKEKVSDEELERKAALAAWERKWSNEEITDDEYFEKFKDGRFVL